MGVRPAGQGSPKGRPRSGGRGNDFVGLQRSEGEAKWWDPAVLDAPVARPSEWDNREPGPLPHGRLQMIAETFCATSASVA